MIRTTPILLASATILLSACDGGTSGPNGPLAFGIVAGNHQTAVAGSPQLTDPVVGKMVRTPSGSIAFSFVTPAYAQDGTTVNGSPVAGAVVCAVSVTAGGLVPFTPCTNTGADGTAVFFFAPGTRAGEARSEIRGTMGNQPAVFDTAVATVQPGAPGALAVSSGQGGGKFGSGDLPYHFPDGLVQDAYGNPAPYSLQADLPLTISGDDSRTLALADTATWLAGERPPVLKVGIRVVAGGNVVATGEVTNQGSPRFSVEWKSVTLPWHAAP